MPERRYAAWNGEAMTFDEMYAEMGDYIAHLLLQTTPFEHVSDCKQEALLKLWEGLRHNPKWIQERGFTGKAGLARRLAYDGRQQHAAWGPVQRLYEQRVVNEATLNDWCSDDADDEDIYRTIGGHRGTRHTDFWRDLAEIEPRNLDVILYADGCHPDWRELADIRLDLVAAIDHVFRNIQKDKQERTGWALMHLVYGVTVEQAAFMAGVTRPAMNAHVIRCRKLMREKLLPYNGTTHEPSPNNRATHTTGKDKEDQRIDGEEQPFSPLAIPQLKVWLKVLARLEQPTNGAIPTSSAGTQTEATWHSPNRVFTMGVMSVLFRLANVEAAASNTGKQSTRREMPAVLPTAKARVESLGMAGTSHLNVMMDGVLLRYPL